MKGEAGVVPMRRLLAVDTGARVSVGRHRIPTKEPFSGCLSGPKLPRLLSSNIQEAQGGAAAHTAQRLRLGSGDPGDLLSLQNPQEWHFCHFHVPHPTPPLPTRYQVLFRARRKQTAPCTVLLGGRADSPRLHGGQTCLGALPTAPRKTQGQQGPALPAQQSLATPWWHWGLAFPHSEVFNLLPRSS